MIKEAKKHILNICRNKDIQVGGSQYTLDQQELIIKNHLILKNHGFGHPHSFEGLGEKLLKAWVDALIDAHDELVSKGEIQYIESLDVYYRNVAGDLLDGNENFNMILSDLLNPFGKDINGRPRVFADFKFIDLFAGIGGFHTAMHSVGGKCVFASEWDKNARISYEENYKNIDPDLFVKDNDGKYLFFNEDITKANPSEIPAFDICCGGFPCQPFSVAGLKKGFDDTRGTLFFNIANIVKEKISSGVPPRVLFLENVRGLKNHDKGNTLKVILATLDELGYGYSYSVLNAKYFGVPQNRERLFIIAWYKKMVKVNEFKFPLGIALNGETIYEKEKLKEGTLPTKVSDIFEPEDTIDPNFTISDRLWEGHQRRKERNKMNGKGFGYSLFNGDSTYTSTISARYYKDGSEILIDQSDKGMNPRKLTPVEAGRLQGYRIIGNGWQNPECAENQNYNENNLEYKIVVSKKEAYHQFGNSVAIPVIKRLSEEIVKQLM
jgi:DNA (cytosine-5)-methyltransferase 1